MIMDYSTNFSDSPILLKVKKLHENAVIPHRATAGSAGMDLHACMEEPVTILPQKLVMIPTGIAVSFPQNCVGFVFARSGLGVKHGITLSNGVGVIDSDYRGELRVGLCNVSDMPYTVKPGERIAQFVLSPLPPFQIQESAVLDETDRGSSGFGSTGR